ncbi:CPP1-like family protein [Oculatella sp. LEGE 06141]|uniref:CPP1-like family protein n=1 Tax=Oculatella sp. LEGE 06141 TaxID=1828648 RepID=UPI00187E98DA|nr:CPP1-like family protein [Oculatella sp. LEGE 06141]MBE9179188.1 CPP1-like family protein [Oculatella sp. LEGE 06141]
MSEQNHYEKLGVDESASFDEIQDARNRLIMQYSADRKQVEAIESAYDAILMDRLRQRQEGKIKVPDRIRFPERVVEPPPEFTPAPPKQTPDWLQRFVDTPSQSDILWPAGLFLGVSLLSFSAPSLALALGVGFSLYFLNRKEHKFGRAFLLTLVGLIVGVVLGLQLGALVAAQLAGFNLEVTSLAALVALFILWLMSSFLR